MSHSPGNPLLNPTGRHLPVNGLNLWVMEAGAGAGAPLLLLHGIAASSETWLPVLPALAAGRRVIAPDLPGCRRSDKPDTGYGVEVLASRILGLLDALVLDRVDLLGHSLGGHIALTLALAHPARVRSLVLVDAGGLGPEINLEGLEPVLQAANEANVARFLATAMHRPERLPATLARMLARELGAPAAHAALYVMARSAAGPDGQRHVLAARLGELQPRTLVVWGEHDAVVPARHGLAAAERAPGARFVAIPDCGHCPHLEQPAAFVSAVTQFLQETDTMTQEG